MTYARAVALLFSHPSIVAVPLLAAVVAVLVDRVTPFLTDPLGGLGTSLLGFLVQIVFLWAFGIAIVQASNIWRKRRGSFDEAWPEGRAKSGGILLAAIGFQFVVYAGGLIGSYVHPLAGLFLEAIAAFFLIYTIPAAAIGGMPGSLALSASVRAVRANVSGSVVLAIVFVALWIFLPYGLQYAVVNFTPIESSLTMALVRAVVLAYLAFPFAKQYDDVAFTRYR
ncbi:MAG TPA: hypothetical protein VMF61_09180 [Candidatus Acidoferrales bacterium]|nr:hypothetical protein [Candidatus Acidoferrales bacterium]